MKYKTYNCNSFNIYTIKTDRFKTSHLEVIFKNVLKKEEIGTYSFLADMLSEGCKKYPRKKDLITRFEELYKIVIYASTMRVGNVIDLHFSLDFINPEYIEDEGYIEDVIKTLFEVILNPNVCNDEFDLKTFNIVKERLRREINSLKENPVKQSIKEAIKTMDSNSPTSYEILGTIEELENITPAKLYNAYKSLRKNFKVDVFLIGNLDMDNVASLIKKYFKNRYIVSDNFEVMVDNKETKKVKVKAMKSDNIQTNLVMLFNLKNLSELEKNITLNCFNYLYGSGGLTSKLYKSIREENSLCYAINSMYLKYDKLLMVQISLDNCNVKKAISLVKKELKSMQNGNFSEEEVRDAINNMVISLDMSLDNNIAILNNYVFNIYDKLPSIEERKEYFKKLTKEDIVNVSKKVKLNTIFTLEGR
ncbi:peptidase M16 domain protein [Firmicutes bacterium CAG:460]|nr:peptidase M16 domain protein [Firmicutes bacterium CAG:460]